MLKIQNEKCKIKKKRKITVNQNDAFVRNHQCELQSDIKPHSGKQQSMKRYYRDYL